MPEPYCFGMEINGLPLHPLLVHAVVVFVPLAAVLGIAFAALPRWRTRLAWPTAGGAVLALLLTQLAIMSGEDFKEALNVQTPQVLEHADLGGQLRIAVIVFAVLALAGAWVARQPKYAGIVSTVVSVVVALSAVAVLVLAFLTGEAGARAVWG